MEMRVFTIFDSAVGAYLQPFFMKSKGEAIRAVTEIVNDVNHMVGKYPADYVLFELGLWDDATAMFKSHAAPINLGVCIEFKRNLVGSADDFVDVKKSGAGA